MVAEYVDHFWLFLLFTLNIALPSFYIQKINAHKKDIHTIEIYTSYLHTEILFRKLVLGKVCVDAMNCLYNSGSFTYKTLKYLHHCLFNLLDT